MGLRFFEQAGLPFARHELEPWISAETVAHHYDGHHRELVERLDALADHDPSLRRPLEELACECDTAAARLAGEAWSHDFYWRGLRPGGGGTPVGALRACLDAAFGGFANCQRRLAEAATGHFGSGWAWLVLDERDRVRVATTRAGDHPTRHGLVPLYAIDVWEHAYSLDGHRERHRYVQSLIDHLIDWDFVLGNLERATGARGGAGARRRER